MIVRLDYSYSVHYRWRISRPYTLSSLGKENKEGSVPKIHLDVVSSRIAPSKMAKVDENLRLKERSSQFQ